MKFLFRFLIVSVVAAGLGFVLYYAVQALPNDFPPTGSSAVEVTPPNGLNEPGNLTSRPERPENNRDGGIRWGSIARIGRDTILFAVLVFFAVLAKNFLFSREANPKRSVEVGSSKGGKPHR